MVHLSATDVQRISRAASTLLSPSAFGTLDGWRHAVNAVVGEVVGADSAGFLLPAPDAAPIYSAEHPPEALAAFPEIPPPALRDGTPIWSRVLEMGVSTIESAYREDAPLYYASAYYNEFARPGGAAHSASIAMPVGEPGLMGAASLQLWREGSARTHFGDREIALLRLLEPAFHAGIEGWMRFGGQGVALMRTIDLLDQAVLACDANGATVHVTPAVGRLLADDPEASVVLAGMSQLASATPPADEGAEVWTRARHTVRTSAGRYILHACLHREPSGVGTEPLVLVSLQRESGRRRTAEELRTEFGLTAAEVQVARLLADGRRNTEVAAALSISEHTARRHTERVFTKLGIRSRAEVARRLDG